MQALDGGTPVYNAKCHSPSNESLRPRLIPSTSAFERQPAARKEGSSMFLILAVVLVLLWLGGFFVLHVSSFLIHLLLLFALISIIMNFVGGRRAV
jgi:Family of unknown function (DUF5670)